MIVKKEMIAMLLAGDGQTGGIIRRKVQDH